VLVAAARTTSVAESVYLGAPEPVRLPLTLSGAVAGMRVDRTLVRVYKDGLGGHSGERWSADITLSDPGDPGPGIASPQLAIGVLSKPDDPSGRTYRDTAPNTTVDGLPALLGPSRTALVVWGVSGTRVYVKYQARPGDALAAYADVHVVASPADPAGWPMA
jgi:hypothetical protein